MLTARRISIFIPAFNAAAAIKSVVERIPSDVYSRLCSIWIIDDGSTDGTGALIDDLAGCIPSIRTIHFERNSGYGSAACEGAGRCRDDGSDYAVCLHADGQYPPERIPAFIDVMEKHSIDILQGSRIASGGALAGGMPLYKFAANRILTFFENIVFGLTMTDYHSGYLFYSRRALDTIPFERLSRSFDFDLEAIACARARGLRIGELPIPTRYAGEVSHVKSIPYGLRCLRVMARYAIGSYRK